VIIEKPIGPHTFCFEEPDIFVARFHGPLEADHVRALSRARAEHGRDLPYILFLADQTHLGDTSAEARRAFREEGRSHLPSATAIVGASRTMRVLADLAFRAINFFRRDPVHFRFFEDEASARAWLNEMRPVLVRAVA